MFCGWWLLRALVSVGRLEELFGKLTLTQKDGYCTDLGSIVYCVCVHVRRCVCVCLSVCFCVCLSFMWHPRGKGMVVTRGPNCSLTNLLMAIVKLSQTLISFNVPTKLVIWNVLSAAKSPHVDIYIYRCRVHHFREGHRENSRMHHLVLHCDKTITLPPDLPQLNVNNNNNDNNNNNNNNNNNKIIIIIINAWLRLRISRRHFIDYMCFVRNWVKIFNEHGTLRYQVSHHKYDPVKQAIGQKAPAWAYVLVSSAFLFFSFFFFFCLW